MTYCIRRWHKSWGNWSYLHKKRSGAVEWHVWECVANGDNNKPEKADFEPTIMLFWLRAHAQAVIDSRPERDHDTFLFEIHKLPECEPPQQIGLFGQTNN